MRVYSFNGGTEIDRGHRGARERGDGTGGSGRCVRVRDGDKSEHGGGHGGFRGGKFFREFVLVSSSADAGEFCDAASGGESVGGGKGLISGASSGFPEARCCLWGDERRGAAADTQRE